VTGDPYPLRDAARYPTAQLAHGAKVHRALCDACHTMHGANALVELTRTWTDDQLRLNIAKLQRTKGFMPPFAGNAEDVEALVQLLRWETAGAPTEPLAGAPREPDPEVLVQIRRWLDEVGTRPAPLDGGAGERGAKEGPGSGTAGPRGGGGSAGGAP
jgi:mono/diheme cytochrome c family protein